MNRRRLLKTITWRITATFIDVVVVLAVTGSVGLALVLGGIDAVTKMIAYYLHEAAWDAKSASSASGSTGSAQATEAPQGKPGAGPPGSASDSAHQ